MLSGTTKQGYPELELLNEDNQPVSDIEYMKLDPQGWSGGAGYSANSIVILAPKETAATAIELYRCDLEIGS